MFDVWVSYFRANRDRQRVIEEGVDWRVDCRLSLQQRDALGHSLRRFERGEDGDGRRLLAHAARGDAAYAEALGLLVAEEQRHSALFRRGLAHLGVPPLSGHWSEAGFQVLRRMLGLRTEVLLFLVAEAVAMEYFEALRDAVPDPVLRGIGLRIATDEVEHIRFQVDGLRALCEGWPAPARLALGLLGGVAAVGAATVLAVDHRAALNVCGLRPGGYWWRALRRYRGAAGAALGGRDAGIGPTGALREFRAGEAPRPAASGEGVGY